MASQEAQEMRTREAAVAAGLVLQETDMLNKEQATTATEERAPPMKKLKGFVAASQSSQAPETKLVSLQPLSKKPGYFKIVDLPDAFPTLPLAATLLRDVTVAEAGSLFFKFVGNNLTEDLVARDLEAYVPMKIQLRQEEVWSSQFQRNKAAIGSQRMLDAGQARYEFMRKACGTGWPDAAKQCWVCPDKESVPFKAPSATYEGDGIT